MKHNPFRNLFATLFFVVMIMYGAWGILNELLKTMLPFGIILAVILSCAGYFLRIPPPSSEVVEAVLGKDPFHVRNNENMYVMKTVAHRGAGLDAPENSLTAFKMCAEKGCDAIEFDVILTKDNVPIVFHDNSLERVTDLKMFICNHSWSDLSNIDISVKHIYKDRFSKTNIPTLKQTVAQLLDCGQRMFIDIKDTSSKMVKVIHDLFEQYPDLYSRAVVSSFYPTVLYLIRKGNPKIVCSMAWRPHVFAYESYNYPLGKGLPRTKQWYKHYLLELCDVIHEWALPKVIYYFIGLSAILLHKDVINGKTVLNWREKGVRVIAWTVNTPIEKQYLARVLKITYLTDTLIGEGTTHSTPS